MLGADGPVGIAKLSCSQPKWKAFTSDGAKVPVKETDARIPCTGAAETDVGAFGFSRLMLAAVKLLVLKEL